MQLVDDNDKSNNIIIMMMMMMMVITLCNMFTGAVTVNVLGFRPSHKLMHEVGSFAFYL